MPNRRCAAAGPRVDAEPHPLGTPEFIRVWCRAYATQPVRHLEFCGWPVGYAESDGVAVQVFYTTAETFVTTVYRASELARPQGPGDLWATFGAEHDSLEGAGEWLASMTPHDGKDLVGEAMAAVAAKVGTGASV